MAKDSTSASLPNSRAYDQVRLLKGLIPDVFETGCPDRIAYLHIDLNQAPAEIAALDHLFDRMVPGGILVLDDYEWAGTYRRKSSPKTPGSKRGDIASCRCPPGKGWSSSGSRLLRCRPDDGRDFGVTLATRLPDLLDSSQPGSGFILHTCRKTCRASSGTSVQRQAGGRSESCSPWKETGAPRCPSPGARPASCRASRAVIAKFQKWLNWFSRQLARRLQLGPGVHHTRLHENACAARRLQGGSSRRPSPPSWPKR